MKNIILTKEQKDNLTLLSKNSSGCYGECYDYKGKVLKLFKREISPEDYQNIKANLKRTSDIIMYPTSKVFLFDKKPYFKGYICDKAPGIDLSSIRSLIWEGKKDITFDSFLTGYYDRFLPQLKKEDVLLSDIKLEHIFFNDCFYLIDTDWYKSRPDDMMVEQKDEKNIKKINTYLGNFIFNFLSLEACDNIIFDICLGDISNESYIKKIFDSIIKATNGEINSFNELVNYRFIDSEEERKILII